MVHSGRSSCRCFGFLLRQKSTRRLSRLLSSALVIFTIAITQHQTTWGVVVASISALVCLYWGFAYSKLDLER
jgi:hypothetical protein